MIDTSAARAAAALLGIALALGSGHVSLAQDDPPPEAGDEAGLDPAPADPLDESLQQDGAASEEPLEQDDPAPIPGEPLVTQATAPFGFLLSDSELVYGTSLWGFDTVAFVDARGGFLSQVGEAVGGEILRGPQIVQRVAQDYGVGPRVLLTLVELNSGWLTLSSPPQRTSPLADEVQGVHAGLSAAAESLLAAYYQRKLTGADEFALADGVIVTLPETNSGTYALMAWLGARTDSTAWAGLEYPSRFWATWTRLFGDPLTYDIAWRFPGRAAEPELAEPLPPSQMWFYLRGPYGPAGQASPWAAVDFAPPPETAVTCATSEAWVTAVATGTVVRSRAGSLVVELDDDGFAGTGWAHVYRFMGGADLPAVGRRVRAGERLGHPSCEGGATAPARVSFARMYDGEWIGVADPVSPLVLGSWVIGLGPREGAGPLVGPGFPPRQPAPSKQPAVNGVYRDP